VRAERMRGMLTVASNASESGNSFVIWSGRSLGRHDLVTRAHPCSLGEPSATHRSSQRRFE